MFSIVLFPASSFYEIQYCRCKINIVFVLILRTMVEVVCGIIVGENGLVLIGQRPLGKHLSGKWEFPGGKVQLNESKTDALHRELFEELGSSIQIVFQMKCFSHVYDDGIAITLTPFVCKLNNTEERPNEAKK